MTASHASMRDDFEITVPPVDATVAAVERAYADAGFTAPTAFIAAPHDGARRLR